MAITTKDWRDFPDISTPINAVALEDMESRMGVYADTKVNKATAIINVTDYGWLPGLAADDTIIAAVLAALPITSGRYRGSLFFPKANGLAYNSHADILNLDDSVGVMLIGEGGRSGGAVPPSTLNITGNGTFGISIRSASGFGTRDLALTFDNTFTGSLVRGGHSLSSGLDTTQTKFTRTNFGDGKVSAAFLLDHAFCIDTVLDDCYLNGGQRAVRGSSGSSIYSNTLTMVGGTVGASAMAPFLNPKDGWSFLGVTFEPLVGTGGVNDPILGYPIPAGAAGGILSDIAANAGVCRAISIVGCNFFDSLATVGTGTTASSTTITSATPTQNTFLVGQAISGAGIPAGTRITNVVGSTLTISNAATASASGVALTAIAGKWIDFSLQSAAGVGIIGGLAGHADTGFDLGNSTNVFVGGQQWAGTYITKRVNATSSRVFVTGTGDSQEILSIFGQIIHQGAINNYIAWRLQNNINNAIIIGGIGGANDAFVVGVGGQFEHGDGSAARDVTHKRVSANYYGFLTSDLGVRTAGRGLRVAEGSNAKQGTATLVAGTVTVANTSVTASSRIFLTVQSLGTVTTPKPIAVTARVAGTSFTITSADATDTSVIAYEIFEAAA